MGYANKNWIQMQFQNFATKIAEVFAKKAEIPSSLPASDTTSSYSATGTAPVNGTAVNKALQTLDVASKGGSGQYIQSISETDGKIYATAATMPATLPANGGTAKTISETLPVSKGGTGQTSALNAANAFIAALDLDTRSIPGDYDYFISQWVNGGDTYNIYFRRPFLRLWDYIKSKINAATDIQVYSAKMLSTVFSLCTFAPEACSNYVSLSITRNYLVIGSGNAYSAASGNSGASDYFKVSVLTRKDYATTNENLFIFQEIVLSSVGSTPRFSIAKANNEYGVTIKIPAGSEASIDIYLLS